MSRTLWTIATAAILFATAVLTAPARGADSPATPPAADPAARQQEEAKLIDTLKGDASRADKSAACRRLQMIGTAACVPALAGLLSNAEMSHMARYALEAVPGPEAAAALREAVAKTAGLTRVGVINSLGVCRDAAAVGDLAKRLKDADADTVAAAAVALGRIGTAEAAAVLDSFRESAAGPGQAVAAEASLNVAEGLVRGGKAPEATKIYEDLQAAKWPKHIRMAAFVGLLAAQSDQAVALVAKALAGEDPVLRAVAIARVAGLKAPGVGERFAAELPKLAPDVQVLLIAALADRGDAAVRPAIVEAMASQRDEVRLAAAKALGVLGDASCVELLCKTVAEAKSPLVKDAAADGLRRIRGDAVDAAILKVLKAAAPQARVELIAVLTDRKAVAAVAELLQQVAEQDKDVRAAALKALGRLGEPKDLPALLKFLVEMKDPAARKDAVRAIVLVSRKIAEEPAQADATLDALAAAGDPAAKAALLEVLGTIANAKSFAAVQTALKDANAEIQDAAFRALADWPSGQALPALVTLFRGTTNPTQRVLALRGCVRMLNLGGRPAGETIKLYGELLAEARRPEDRKLVLAGLAGAADPAALKLVEGLLADKEVAAEAELAMLTLARNLMGSARDDARAAAEKLIAQTANDALREQAKAILAQTEKFEDYVTAWQVSGPYEEAGKAATELFNIAYPPEKDGGKTATWKILPTAGSSKEPWLLNLAALMPGNERCCYVRTFVQSDRDQPAQLEFGTDDGNKVWFNGKVVNESNRGGKVTPGEYKVKVDLHKGWNTLLLKITQFSGPWEFCLRIRDGSGAKLTGTKIQATPPAE